jgi:hypothetical protein
MESWQGWPLDRFLYIFLGLAFLMVWVQLTLFHWRGAFRHIAMWGPVIFTPVIALISIVYGFARGGFLDLLLIGSMGLAVLEGLGGAYYHFKGIASQVGGFNLRNSTTGPPPVLPLMYMALGALGLLIYYWPRIAPAQ